MITPKKPRAHGHEAMSCYQCEFGDPHTTHRTAAEVYGIEDGRDAAVRSIVDAAPTVTADTFDHIAGLFRIDRHT